MKTEMQLQSQVVGSLYFLAALSMMALSIQNYRYGLYPLVYSASLITLICFGIACYAKLAYKISNLERASLAALCISMLLIVKDSMSYATDVMYWAYPLGLFSYLALTLRQANALNAAVALFLSISLVLNATLHDALAFAASYTLLIALGSTFAKLHQKRSRSLVELAITEPLTSAYNMRHLDDTLRKEICRSDRTGNPLSIIALEVDYFSQVSEAHGYSTSNNLLKQVSGTLEGMIRAGDSQYFDGKARFYLMLPCTPAEGVLVIAERIRRTIQESSWPAVESLTASLGCASLNPEKGEISAERMLNYAHDALFEAQRNGHNKVSLHA